MAGARNPELEAAIRAAAGGDAVEPFLVYRLGAKDDAGVAEHYRTLVAHFEVEESELSWSHPGDVPPLWRHAGRLARLKLRCGSFELGRIAAPSLARFEIETGGLTKANWRAILEADWPALESLVVYFGDSNYGADCDVGDVRPLLDGKAPAGLRHLGLHNCELGDELAAAVAGSAILPRLETLSLAMGTMGEEGARAILSSRKAFAHLRQLDLSENYIPEPLVEELRSVCAEVVAGQRDDGAQYDPEARYVVVGE